VHLKRWLGSSVVQTESLLQIGDDGEQRRDAGHLQSEADGVDAGVGDEIEAPPRCSACQCASTSTARPVELSRFTRVRFVTTGRPSCSSRASASALRKGGPVRTSISPSTATTTASAHGRF
jgi:hypothetical protein